MTENPIIRFWLWYYDMLWQYWPVWLVLIVIAVYLIERHFCKEQQEWDAFMECERRRDAFWESERKRLEELKRDLQKYRSQKERDLYEKDVIEVNLKNVKTIK